VKREPEEDLAVMASREKTKTHFSFRVDRRKHCRAWIACGDPAAYHGELLK